jgi:hypothetical protein
MEATHKMIDSMRGTPALLAVIVLQLAKKTKKGQRDG